MPKKPKYIFNPEETQKIVREYEEGAHLRALAKVYTENSVSAIRRVLVNGGAVIRKRGRPVGTTGIPKRRKLTPYIPENKVTKTVEEPVEEPQVIPEEPTPSLPNLSAEREW
jgi:hypothetical protein